MDEVHFYFHNTTRTSTFSHLPFQKEPSLSLRLPHSHLTFRYLSNVIQSDMANGTKVN